ncbi:hypothetical protein BZJ19_11580 [Salinivibrio proteolyticus]|uniref:hypothetical protein n=1 Tax=Salinivibrio proteolyticus TaxID=334715 RepID=UPI0009889F0C|nr:hypothetical protein [Salinivibrio proteolyticus]OOF24012.1 hypothetical protein BZJ19_11580 [Salinivibrio proteolyticus]
MMNLLSANAVPDVTHTDGVTTIRFYEPTAEELAGLKQAQETLDFIYSLDSEAYGNDCLRDVVSDQYRDILENCKLALNYSFVESLEDFHKRG